MSEAMIYAMQRVNDEAWDDPPGFWTWTLAREVVRSFGSGNLDDEARRLVARRCPYRWPAQS